LKRFDAVAARLVQIALRRSRSTEVIAAAKDRRAVLEDDSMPIF